MLNMNQKLTKSYKIMILWGVGGGVDSVFG